MSAAAAMYIVFTMAVIRIGIKTINYDELICFPSQALSEKTKELDKLRSEWNSQTSSLSSRHSQELLSEREKAVEVRR